MLDMPSLIICQEIPTEACACNNNVQVFKKGKSCLFALSQDILVKALSSFPIMINVYRRFPPERLPDMILMGPFLHF